MKTIAFVFALMLPVLSFARVGPLGWADHAGRADRITGTSMSFFQTRDGRLHLARIERTAQKRNYLRLVRLRNCMGLRVAAGDALVCTAADGKVVDLGRFRRGAYSAIDAQVLATGQSVKAALLTGGRYAFAAVDRRDSLSLTADIVGK